jgi:hypothetical protein
MARPPFTFDRNTLGSNGSFLSRFIASPPFAGAHLKTQAILQRRFKKGQSACPDTLARVLLGRAWTFALLRVVRGIRVIFDESRASANPP